MEKEEMQVERNWNSNDGTDNENWRNKRTGE